MVFLCDRFNDEKLYETKFCLPTKEVIDVEHWRISLIDAICSNGIVRSIAKEQIVQERLQSFFVVEDSRLSHAKRFSSRQNKRDATSELVLVHFSSNYVNCTISTQSYELRF